MNEYDVAYKLAMESIRKRLEKKITKEGALRDLIDAGILDKDGNYTTPYKNLGKAVKDLSK
jgi:hypothetical protein